MNQRENVRIPVDDGAELDAWFYRPAGIARAPAITMAPGYAGSKEHKLNRFAEAFSKAGFAVLLHDHRGFGPSSGEPRQEVDPWKQIADWRRAISYLESRPEVDPSRIGIWGSSFTGGHALVLGATDRRIKAVVAQIPTISGYASGLRRIPADKLPELHERLAEDDRARLRGDGPVYQKVVSHDTGEPAAYYNKAIVDFYLQDLPEGSWENRITLRSILNARMYEPGHWVDRVSPTPLLMVVAKDDTIAPTDLALAAYEKALEPKRLALVDGDHCDPYLDQFEASSAAALNWFIQYLRPSSNAQ
jgi:dienelactone hydrolase